MEWTQLLQPSSRVQLLLNHRRQLPVKGTEREIAHKPACRLHIPYTYCEWLLSECDDQGMAFGFCQIRYGELGSVWLPEVAELDIKGMRVVEDINFVPTMTVAEYAAKARQNGGLLCL